MMLTQHFNHECLKCIYTLTLLQTKPQNTNLYWLNLLSFVYIEKMGCFFFGILSLFNLHCFLLNMNAASKIVNNIMHAVNVFTI